MSKPLKVAIVHDWLYGGGAELVVQELHRMFPNAPIYTSYCSDEWRQKLDNKVVTGYLQHWPFARLRKFLPILRQWWFSRLDLSEFDVIISSSGNGEAKFVRPKKSATHICYCHSPNHFYWRKYEEYIKEPGFRPKWLVRIGLKLLVKPLRKRDYAAAQKVDYFIANSAHIQHDIKEYYNRSSRVIHPPVDTANFKPVASSSATIDTEPRFIIWGRHVPYKRIDIAIEACNNLKLPLTVIGEGPSTPDLKKLAGSSITFAGFATKENLVKLASNAQAFIFPTEEDFGISPVEAMALGLPVIAYRAAGALDYIVEGKTGTFFTAQTAESLEKALSQFNASDFSATKISAFVKKFSQEEFRKEMARFLKSKFDEKLA